MSDTQLHVESLDDMGRRFVTGWHRLEAGEAIDQRHFSFDRLETMLRLLSPRRLDMLRLLRREPQNGIAELARRLGRDYSNVHDDVQALTAVGLIERRGRVLHVPFSEIGATLSLEGGEAA